MEKLADIGVFGGSGFYSFLEDIKEVKIDTPYGIPRDFRHRTAVVRRKARGRFDHVQFADGQIGRTETPQALFLLRNQPEKAVEKIIVENINLFFVHGSSLSRIHF